MGNVKGLGSRVELLYKGTTTDATGGAGVWVEDIAAFTPPAWCKTVSFFGRISVITIGAGANLSFAAFRADADGILTTSAGASRGIETTAIVTPTFRNGVNINIGFDLTEINTAPIAGVATRNHPVFPGPKVGFSHNWATAPTSWSLVWAVYCSG